MKTLLYIFFVILFFSMVNCGPALNSSANRNQLEGWHFHVCSNQTKASRVWFELSGTTSKSKYQSRELKWTSGNNAFVSVPEDMRFINDLNLSVKTSGKRKARVCVLYGDYVIETMDVSGTESQTLNKEHRDDCPC
jgi:hypothetical protein